MTEPALFGLHGNPAIARALARQVQKYFQMEHVSGLEEMLARCRERQYGLYVMDLNLGVEGGFSIEPARKVYRLLQELQVSALPRRFIGVSADPSVVESARQEGIPAVEKTDFTEYFGRFYL